MLETLGGCIGVPNKHDKRNGEHYRKSQEYNGKPSPREHAVLDFDCFVDIKSIIPVSSYCLSMTDAATDLVAEHGSVTQAAVVCLKIFRD